MSARQATAPLAALLALLALAAPAQAKVGLQSFDAAFLDSEGASANTAGTHPDSYRVELKANTVPVKEGIAPDESVKNLNVTQMRGFAGDQTAAPRCETPDFLTQLIGTNANGCPDATAVGLVVVEVATAGGVETIEAPLYNLEPSPGRVARLGFHALEVPVTIEVGLADTPPYNIVAYSTDISQVLEFLAAEVTLWGVPADPAHDPERGACYDDAESCPAGIAPAPFITTPRACEGPLETAWEIDSWQRPGAFVRGEALTHDDATPPNPEGMSGCGALGFEAATQATPSNAQAESASGLRFTIDVSDEGLKSPTGTANADIAKVVAELPAGVTANPSAAEGLGVCSAGQFASASIDDPGCPGPSKLGTVQAKTPLLEDHPIEGSLYLADPGDNPFDSLLALYMVFRDAELGILITQAGEVDTDPKSGRLVTTFEDLPPYPLSEVEVSMRSGPRAPLITPPRCGTYETVTTLHPSSGKAPLEDRSEFEIDSGPGGSGCPSGLPFSPGFAAGSANNAAGAYSPFLMRLTRQDGEQDLTKFSAVLPPGVTARLAGLTWCPDAAIARAASRDGEDELDSPSCPATSQIGRVVAGAGVGSQLTHVHGSLYLSGPYNSAPLSVVAIVPAVAGPFDVGTVVTRVGLRLNPKTGQGEVDGAASDPIPHILEGIPLKVRDIRVLADRPSFTLNPTSCQPSNTFATIWGGGSHPFSAADDLPFGAASRFQAASCAALQFKPKLAIKLRGGVKRGAHPALRAIVTPPPGQANFSRAVVTLPRSAFLEQAHIRTICTRVQFNAPPGHGAHCPPGAQYGFARAWSPLLDAPAQGPVFLRSSDNQLPDLVVALKGPASAPVDVELSSRIDSVRGGIRSTFTGIPDLPVSRFILDMQGGKKGLIVNSRHLCHKPGRNRATANLRGQNGRFSKTKPRVIAVKCAKRRKAKRQRAKRSAQRRAYLARASAVGGER